VIAKRADLRADRLPSEGTGGRLIPDFESVYRNHAEAVYRFCLAQLGDQSAAEDCAADAFAAALAAYERTQPTAGLVRSWLFSIAHNTTVNWVRRERVRKHFVERVRTHTDDQDVESVAALRADLNAALEAIGRLPTRDRVLVGLRAAAGLSYPEIASVMGMKENAARMATARAFARIRKEVNDDE
jgi:RNA polymerase sigma-70 factor (ECF subfamily)